MSVDGEKIRKAEQNVLIDHGYTILCEDYMGMYVCESPRGDRSTKELPCNICLSSLMIQTQRVFCLRSLRSRSSVKALGLFVLSCSTSNIK